VEEIPDYHVIEAKNYSLDWVSMLKTLLAKSPGNRHDMGVIMKHDLWRKSIKHRGSTHRMLKQHQDDQKKKSKPKAKLTH